MTAQTSTLDVGLTLAAEGTERRMGVVFVIAAAVAFSTAGLFTRLIPNDVWTMLFWRGLFGGMLIAGGIVWRHRASTHQAFAAIGSAGLAVATCSTVATICFVTALRRTTVADVTLIYATAPFVAALIAWVWTRERRRVMAIFGHALLGTAPNVFGKFAAVQTWLQQLR